MTNACSSWTPCRPRSADPVATDAPRTGATLIQAAVGRSEDEGRVRECATADS